jgi:hypothetical protein
MRPSILILVLAAAAPAAAQPYGAIVLNHDAEALAAREAARQRDIAVTNELSRLEAQAQANQALAGLAAQRATPSIVILPRAPGAPPPKIDLGQLAQIPDAVLADSNAKVRAASQNRK